MKPDIKISPPGWMTTPQTTAVMRALGAFEDDPGALFVGGCVRNQLLEAPAGDIDIATVWAPEQVIGKLTQAGIKAVPTGIEHGTVTAVADGKPYEITTLRRDVATDGRRAVVAFSRDWAEDARRRDFTMNALYAGADGAVYDPTGEGLADLKTRSVRFVGDPAARIAEDYLRILRFFRFHAQYGKGALDAAGLAACRAGAKGIASLSRERITQEMLKILAVDDPVDVLAVMFENSILPGFPDPEYKPEILRRLCAGQSRYEAVDVMARLFVLNKSGADQYMVLSNAQKKRLEDLGKAATSLRDTSEMTIKLLIYKFNSDVALQVLLIRGAEEKTVRIAREWKAPAFPVTGDDLIKAGIPAGPELGRRLAEIESWWIENGFTPDREACLKRLA